MALLPTSCLAVSADIIVYYFGAVQQLIQPKPLVCIVCVRVFSCLGWGLLAAGGGNGTAKHYVEKCSGGFVAPCSQLSK